MKEYEKYHAELEAAGHELIREESGEIDILRLSIGYHNGPECKKCGQTWCEHCRPTIRKCCGK